MESSWPFAHTWRMRHKMGDWRWTLCRAATLLDSRGVPSRCVAIFTDVTEQVLTERRLSDLTRRTELLLSSAGEGFLGIDENASITFANPAASELLRCPLVDLVGKKVTEVLGHGCPPDQPCAPGACPILKSFTDGGVHRLSNGRFTRRDGSSFAIDYVATPAREGSDVVGVVFTFRDVTEQRRLEEQHLQGQKLEAIGQLAAGIAHEINTPMQYIGDNVSFLDGSFADLLKLVQDYRSIIEEVGRDPANEALVARALASEETADVSFLADRVPGAIAATVDGIARVRKIVYAMKEFSHPGRAETAPADLNHAVESTLAISANTWKNVATVDMRLDPHLPSVTCHVNEINQVILNLVVNAAHAIADLKKSEQSESLGTIRIETGTREGWAEIHISDTGGGIPEHVRDKIFDPFFTTKEVGRGTGQGLTLARSIVVDRHVGTLTFTTESGKGTTFVVRLPLDP
jgi:PAS domain S-box-containing protein